MDPDLFDPIPSNPDGSAAERLAALTARVESLDAQLHATAALAYFAFEELERLSLRFDLPSPSQIVQARLRVHDPRQDGLSAEMLTRRERALSQLMEQLQWAERQARSRGTGA